MCVSVLTSNAAHGLWGFKPLDTVTFHVFEISLYLKIKIRTESCTCDNSSVFPISLCFSGRCKDLKSTILLGKNICSFAVHVPGKSCNRGRLTKWRGPPDGSSHTIPGEQVGEWPKNNVLVSHFCTLSGKSKTNQQEQKHYHCRGCFG